VAHSLAPLARGYSPSVPQEFNKTFLILRFYSTWDGKINAGQEGELVKLCITQ